MDLPERIILHVGMTKTGSTLVQNILDQSRDSLLAQGVLFPASVFTRKDPDDLSRTSGHLELLRMLARGDTKAFQQEVKEAGEAVHTLLLSSESLLDQPRQNGFRQFQSLFSGREVHIVAVVRNQAEWLSSRYFESVTKGWKRETRSFDDFCLAAIDDGLLDYERNIRTLARSLGAASVRVLDYDRLTEQGTLLPETLAALECSVSLSPVDLQRHDNVSHILPEAVQALRRINALMVNVEASDRLAVSHRLRMLARTVERDHTGVLCPSCAVRDAVLRASALSNAALSATYLDGAPFGPDQTWVVQDPAGEHDTDLEDRLFDDGLRFLLRQVDRLPLAATTFDHRLHALPAVIQHCRAARVILNLASDLTEVLAAGLRGCLIYTPSCEKLRNIRTLHALDTADSPGRVVFLETDAPDVLPSDDVWQTDYFRHPDLILLPLHLAPEMLDALSKQISRPVLVHFLSGDMGVYKSITLRPPEEQSADFQGLAQTSIDA